MSRFHALKYSQMNNTNYLRTIAFLLISVCLLGLSWADAQTALTDDEIRAILKDRIDRAHRGVGIVVGIVDEKETRVIGYGKASADSTATVDGDTVFEIGSITKTFTATLLAHMVEKGMVSLDDPVQKHLPATVKVPMRGGKQITLADLSSHISGLPRMPGNFTPKDWANPYVDYTVAQMFEFISGYTLPRDIGEKVDYSNLGVALLGQALAYRAGKDYETLVREVILEPLKMKNTSIKFTPWMQQRLARGHDADLKPAANWDLPTFAGAGALRSTVNDMLKYVAAEAGIKHTKLLPIMRATQEQRHTISPTNGIGLGWFITKATDGTLTFDHDGGTGGYVSYAVFDREKRRGVVVLSNAALGVTDLGRYILDTRNFLAWRERKTVKIEPATFDTYAGIYRMGPTRRFVFGRESESYYYQAAGAVRRPLIPMSATRFYSPQTDAEVEFSRDEAEGGMKFSWEQFGNKTPGLRLNVEPFDPATFAPYSGRYRQGDNMFIMTSEAGRYYFQYTNESRFEMIPISASKFWAPIVDAEASFVKDESGSFNLVWRQNGVDGTFNRAAAPILETAVLDKYAGTYRLSPQEVFTIKRDGTRLFAQLTGQPAFELFAESGAEFFYQDVKARITFEKDTSGRVTGLALHQNGRDLPAPRVN